MNKPPIQQARRRDDSKELLDRYPQWFFEVEDWVMDDPSEYRWEIDLGSPENAKSMQMRFFRFRGSISHPKNRDRWLKQLPNTMGLQVTVRGSKLIFQDINLYCDRFLALKENRAPRTRAKQGLFAQVEAEAPKLVVELETTQNQRQELEGYLERQLAEYKATQRNRDSKPELPPLDPKDQELRDFWKRFPPLFRSILGPLASRASYTVEGTSFGEWPKQWTEVQRELGEPWASIELHLTDRAAIFRWVEGTAPAEGGPKPG